MRMGTEERSAANTSTGYIFSKLIRLSATRQQALDTICEFGKWVVHSASCVDTENVDKICATTYNHGVTLCELGQLQMAEKFLTQALLLLPHTSKVVADEWKTRIQEAYAHILRCQEASKAKSSSLRSMK